jgi:hypothetical protein
MMDSFLFVISIFFVTFTVFILAGMYMARMRLKRTERLMTEMMEEFEQAYAQNPDDGFLRDNIIELRHHQHRRNKDKK